LLLEEYKTLLNLKINIIKTQQADIEKYQSLFSEEQSKNKEFQQQIQQLKKK
jgi:hypothetical protein